MTNKPKAIGTRFETAVVRYLVEQGLEAHRKALTGAHDSGDLEIVSHGRGIMECKAHKTITASDVLCWLDQTLTEKNNAVADWAMLVIKRPRHNVADAFVVVDAELIKALATVPEGIWTTSLKHAVGLLKGESNGA